MLRNGTTPPIGHGVSLDPLIVMDGNASLLCCGNLNWSQRRFLRGNGHFSGPRNVNALFIIREIERQINKQGTWNGEESRNSDVEVGENASRCREEELRKYSRSLRGHQSLLLTLPNLEENVEQEKLLATISKIVMEDAPAIGRVKGQNDETLLREWIGIQKELRAIKLERLVDYKKKLQIAGEQALQEMETNLKKGMNLDDLDQAIEGALCSQAKAEYSQQKSSSDN